MINIALVVSEASLLACTFTAAVTGLNWVLWPNSVVSPNWDQFKSIYWLLPVMTIVWWCCRTHPGAIVTHHHLPALAVHAGAKLCTGNLEAAPPAVRTVAAKTDWLTGRQASPCVPPEGGGEMGGISPLWGEDLRSHWALNAALTHTVRLQLHFLKLPLKLPQEKACTLISYTILRIKNCTIWLLRIIAIGRREKKMDREQCLRKKTKLYWKFISC